jgi:hypothetical protein
MAQQCHQIVKGLHLVQFRGMNQVHEQFADLCAVERFVK